MAASRLPTSQYLSGNFVLSAGSVLFRHVKSPTNNEDKTSSNNNDRNENKLEICILHHLTSNEWLLPKGRKDRGEILEHAAVRETYEETGYRCSLWPQRMPTLATQPGGADDAVHSTQIADNLTEPIAVTVRQLRLGDSRTKMIFWYITLVEEGSEKVEGSQMENESFESLFLEVGEAMERLTFQTDRDVVRQAVEIVQNGTGTEGRLESSGNSTNERTKYT